ncbi:TetR/AcrR family transcriptional regulator [Glaciecola petra]|uniref:TetR/AcrR family transcriptional regulator n=1 Tax=Glaciecola petra TaxID=3075602 RepID=A0ABU2ZRN2_9ALTE|nr:TetR/AcrR family transcriptional regulator [Aestuariibacter sp. P117]MDT0595056.1 TetR/AcrR family transcriptional regulator [Aestuariibacter sp. P117]
MIKKQATKQAILNASMHFVCRYGLSAITIGEVAKLTNMSRTGVISHFQNKADMQIAILRHCEDIFISQVVKPSLAIDPLDNLRRYFDNWMNWVYKLTKLKSMSCPFIKAVAEFQDQETSSVKTVIIEQQQRTFDYIASLFERCQNEGIFNLDLCPKNAAQACYGHYLSHNIAKNLLKNPNADTTFQQAINQVIEKSISHKYMLDRRTL